MKKPIAAKEQREISERLSRYVEKISGGREIVLMEVCGTHTMAIFRHGIKSILPPNIKLVSGPGCPVCVTPTSFIDRAVAYARRNGVILATFGDMIRVPGSTSSLLSEKAGGADVWVVYSATDALKIAGNNPDRKVVFFAAGFETTAPTVAAAVLAARRQRLENFLILCACKVLPPALHALADSGDLRIDGLICPGHVSAVTGTGVYSFLADDYGISCAVTGFDPLDILESVAVLTYQICRKQPAVLNQYGRVVRERGNQRALDLINRVFAGADSRWRGLGVIPLSGLKLKEEYMDLDAGSAMPVETGPARERPGCLCGHIIRGLNSPPDCPLFATYCTPEDPAGPCMVSTEGTCAAYIKYAGESMYETG
ncbi:MAG: hydrogenase formation protein HypD [Bacillota bacterium]